MMTRTNKVGLVLAGVLGLLDVINLASINAPFPAGMTPPPTWLVVLWGVLGVVTLVAIPFAWRGNRKAVLTVVATRILSVLGQVPAYFVEVPSYILATTTVAILLTILAVWLSLRRNSRSAGLGTSEG